VTLDITSFVAMRLSCNMATGKGLAVIFRPKTINLLSNYNNSNKFLCNALQRCNTCQRHMMTATSIVDGWNHNRIGRSNVSYCS